jgi:hypothetical protein
MHDVRPAAVAGMFYPQARARLAEDVRAYLLGGALDCGRAHPRRSSSRTRATSIPRRSPRPRSRRLAALRDRVERRVPSRTHAPGRRARARGAGCRRPSPHPLGEVPLDREAVAARQHVPSGRDERSRARAGARARGAAPVPADGPCGNSRWFRSRSGDATPSEVAEVLDELWGGHGDAHRGELGPVALSPVRGVASHRPRDRPTPFLALSPTLDHEQACGATPVNGLLVCAERRGLAPRSSTCATPGTPRATAHASSVTRRSRSSIMAGAADLGAGAVGPRARRDPGSVRGDGPGTVRLSGLRAEGATFVTLAPGR